MNSYIYTPFIGICHPDVSNGGMLSANNEKRRNLIYNVLNGNKHGATDRYYKELFADHKNSASECNESSLSNCRAQPILSKS